MATIKIAVSGIGAVGGYYGGLLANHYKNASDVEVYFISRGENLKVIKNNGLKIESEGKILEIHPELVTDKPQEIGTVDYLLCCTKSYDLRNNLLALTALLKKDTVIVPFLNGANITGQIQQILPEYEIWKGCVYIGSRLIAPGIVHQFSAKESLFFGSESGDKTRQKKLLDIFTAAGINAYNPDDITSRIWKKFFMISTAATITSYYNKSIDKVIQENYNTFKALCIELKNVASAKGIQYPDDIIESTLETQKMMPPGSITSMHDDFIQGKHTELENLTGYVINEAKASGVDVPTYEKMYNKLKTKAL